MNKSDFSLTFSTPCSTNSTNQSAPLVADVTDLSRSTVQWGRGPEVRDSCAVPWDNLVKKEEEEDVDTAEKCIYHSFAVKLSYSAPTISPLDGRLLSAIGNHKCGKCSDHSEDVAGPNPPRTGAGALFTHLPWFRVSCVAGIDSGQCYRRARTRVHLPTAGPTTSEQVAALRCLVAR